MSQCNVEHTLSYELSVWLTKSHFALKHTDLRQADADLHIWFYSLQTQLTQLQHY